MTYVEYRDRVYDIIKKIYYLSRDTGYMYDNEVTKLEVDKDNPSDFTQYKEANSLLRMLEDCVKAGSYDMSPIQHEGVITRNSNDQYELDGVTLDCGTRFEFLIYDEIEEHYRYVCTTIESDNEGYFLTYNGQREIAGLEARIK